MYKYKFRPNYGSKSLLIDFFYGAENDNFIMDLLNTISEINPKIIHASDLWMNDEILINIDSEIGEFTFSKDTWGFAFLIAENNQKSLLRINSILEVAEHFEKIEVDFEDYKLK